MRCVTRKRLGWTDLTERSAADQGDVIDVWYEDQPWHGVYLGVTWGPWDTVCHEIMLDDRTSKLIPVEREAVICRVKRSEPWPLLDTVYEPLHECEQAMDAREPQPRVTWLEVLCGAALFLAAWAILQFIGR